MIVQHEIVEEDEENKVTASMERNGDVLTVTVKNDVFVEDLDPDEMVRFDWGE
jgi:hypothetical protein